MANDVSFSANKRLTQEQLRTFHKLLTWHYPEFSEQAEDWAKAGEPDPHIWLIIEECIDIINSMEPTIPIPKPEPAYRAKPTAARNFFPSRFDTKEQ